VHGAAAEHMQVQMFDSLPTFFSRINDNPKTFGEAFFRQLCCDQREMAEQIFVCCGGLRERVDVLFWDDKKMRGRLRMNIGEGDGNVIFKDFFSGNFSGDNPTK
jgi:hypothetical protein